MTDEQFIEQLREMLHRAVDDAQPSPRLSAGLVDRPSGRARGPRLGWTLHAWPIPAASVAVVIAVVAIVVMAIHRGGTTQTPTVSASGSHSVTLIYQAQPTPQRPKITHAEMRQTLFILRGRARTSGASRARVQLQGSHQIVVSLSGVRSITAAEAWIGSTAQLEFYDWEANAMLPSSKSVASQLSVRNPNAIAISQGSKGGPGVGDDGGMSLYRAVVLASHQHPSPTRAALSRRGPEYYLFGAPGSAACKAWAQANRTFNPSDTHCWLAGPASSEAQLRSDPLPSGVSYAQGQVRQVPQGWVVLQAVSWERSGTIPAAQPTARFFVLRDHPALSGAQISAPKVIRPNGQPLVQLRFVSFGAAAFRELTAAIAHRGQTDTLGKTPLFQHFAVALDGQLLTVPEVDYLKYPDGVIPTGADHPPTIAIPAGSTTQTARRLATQLRLGQLPVALVLIDKPH